MRAYRHRTPPLTETRAVSLLSIWALYDQHWQPSAALKASLAVLARFTGPGNNVTRCWQVLFKRGWRFGIGHRRCRTLGCNSKLLDDIAHGHASNKKATQGLSLLQDRHPLFFAYQYCLFAPWRCRNYARRCVLRCCSHSLRGTSCLLCGTSCWGA